MQLRQGWLKFLRQNGTIKHNDLKFRGIYQNVKDLYENEQAIRAQLLASLEMARARRMKAQIFKTQLHKLLALTLLEN